MRKGQAILEYIRKSDWETLLLALLCSVFGFFLIASATQAEGVSRQVIVQLAATALGVVAYVLLSLFDLEGMSRYWTAFVIANILLQLLLIPFGSEVGGQRNWINLGAFSLQPGELGKLLFIFSFSAHLTQMQDHLSEWRGIFMAGAHALLLVLVLLVTAGDSGMAIQYLMIAAIMLFAAGVALRWFVAAGVLGVASIPVLWNFVLQDYQKNRILVLFDPSIDPNTAFQSVQAKIAIGSGQLSGEGFRHGAMTQMGAVPEDHTDFIFVVAGEELGFFGCVLLIVLLAALIIRVFYISYCASGMFSTMLAVGIGGMLMFQTFMNLFMCLGLLPVLGLTLPLISYGGTSVVTMYGALGIVAGVRMREKPGRLQ